MERPGVTPADGFGLTMIPVYTQTEDDWEEDNSTSQI